MASVEAFLVDEGYFDDDSPHEQRTLRAFQKLREMYGTKETPSYWMFKYGLHEDDDYGDEASSP